MPDAPFTTLADLTEVIVRALGDADGCGITVVRDGRPVTLSYSAELAAVNDESEYTLGTGPCLEALAEEAEVESRDLAAETRWGDYPSIVTALGLRSVLALPLKGGHGVLNLYSCRIGGLGDTCRREAAEFAEIVGRTVEAAVCIDTFDAAQGLRTAIRHSFEVDQAVGVLMARNGADRAAAFGELLRAAEAAGEGLYDAAARILADSGRRER
ncbi:GAF and ANTAR domain-containing protein [Streptomonospora sp. PA3]|uniref:GAF and ANTAR domain-containing protein n=1 Tax=Streptomonospora sp. PA3 TaxID=2607326 RepID=UPI00164277AB|nr:GAF and ANTAR domain-containing protein [Streptomonospora sp. PA3]